MERWAHQGRVYEVNSMYLLPEDAWAHELRRPDGPSASPGGLIVLIGDATPGGTFTPMSPAHARVIAEDSRLPWLVLRRFVRLLEASGDIQAARAFLADEHGETVAGDLSVSNCRWRFAGGSYEVNSFHFAEHDCWCYELRELAAPQAGGSYIEVRIPDLRPASGPLLPAPASQADFTAHGSVTIPGRFSAISSTRSSPI